MLDKKEFSKLREEFEAYDKAREEIIKRSRDIQKLSKQAIYSLQRDERKVAKTQLQEAEKIVQTLLPKMKKDPTLWQGSFSASLEEYAEAKTFLHFLENNTLLSLKELKFVAAEEYLGALSDLTGELVRHAVLRATKKDKRAVQHARDLIDEIYGQLCQFDFRNSELRRKYDAVKYNLQKVETVLYELS